MLKGFRVSSRITAPLLKQVAISAGIVALFGGSAIATPLFPSTNQSAQPSSTNPKDSKTDSSGDVIVNTESKPSDSNGSGSTTGTAGSNGTSSQVGNARFTCEYQGGQYMVIYHPESQPGKSYPWATPSTMGGGWTPQLRCNEISRRLESYRPDGLQEMRTGMENGYNIVCVTTEKVPGCRIVLTVPPGQDPTSTRDRVFQNLTVADSGQQTQAVNTFVDNGRDGSILDELGRAIHVSLPNLGGASQIGGGSQMSDGINLRPFLDRADGGTGAYLRGGVANHPAPRLDPNKFR